MGRKVFSLVAEVDYVKIKVSLSILRKGMYGCNVRAPSFTVLVNLLQFLYLFCLCVLHV